MKKLITLLLLCGNVVIAQSLMITELTDPQNSSDAGRYVEIYNPSTDDIDLSVGYALQRWTNGNTDPQSAVSLTGIIPAKVPVTKTSSEEWTSSIKKFFS